MLHLLPGRKILTVFATLNVILLVVIASLFDPVNPALGILRYVTVTIAVLDLFVILVATYLWRVIWKYIPGLSEVFFPDLNGIWEGKIMFNSEEGIEKQLDVRVRIKQDLWRINLDVCSETSKSHTLVAYPATEAGSPKLYYMFHNVPKNPEHPEYKGSSILLPKIETSPIELSGHYYTVRGTRGRMELKRQSPNPKGRYEFY